MVIVLAVYPIIFFLGLLILFLGSSSAGTKAVLLFLAMTLFMIGCFRIIGLYVPSLPVESFLKRLASPIGLISGGIYFLLRGQSTIGFGLSWGAIIIGCLSVFTSLQRILPEVLLVRRLVDSYNRGLQPKLKLSYFYLVSQAGIGVLWAHRLSRAIITSLWKIHGKRIVWPLLSYSLRGQKKDVRLWIGEHASALIWVLAPGDPTDLDKESMHQIRLCMGKVFLLQLSVGDDRISTELFPREVIKLTIKFRSADISGFKMEDAVSTITHQLAATTFPIANSDERLDEELITMQHCLANKGLPPIAGAYLRFRLAASDVERFLCLLDCVETLIRISAFVLVANRLNAPDGSFPDGISKLFSRPSLGQWVQLLRDLCQVPQDDAISKNIVEFWSGPLAGAPVQLIDDAKGSGLDWRGQLPRSHLAWLDWFVWIRNQTRGHGSVDEDKVAPIWHSIHETYLLMCQHLGSITWLPGLASPDAKGSFELASGWCREQKLRICKPGVEPAFLLMGEGTDQSALQLYPFVVNAEGTFWLWNSTHDKEIEYIDYGSGQIKRWSLDGTDPIELWHTCAKIYPK
ncbi:MAG: hypothetical protein MUO31_02235 [Thermodesulfovibrionales bacterium]|nr:hypothetical protein [Thermodesulfovibrionales bacterium]